jgi:hypothetical protein
MLGVAMDDSLVPRSETLVDGQLDWIEIRSLSAQKRQIAACTMRGKWVVPRQVERLRAGPSELSETAVVTVPVATEGRRRRRDRQVRACAASTRRSKGRTGAGPSE